MSTMTLTTRVLLLTVHDAGNVADAIFPHLANPTADNAELIAKAIGEYGKAVVERTMKELGHVE